jgi:hypothetical protein
MPPRSALRWPRPRPDPTWCTRAGGSPVRRRDRGLGHRGGVRLAGRAGRPGRRARRADAVQRPARAQRDPERRAHHRRGQGPVPRSVGPARLTAPWRSWPRAARATAWRLDGMCSGELTTLDKQPKAAGRLAAMSRRSPLPPRVSASMYGRRSCGCGPGAVEPNHASTSSTWKPLKPGASAAGSPYLAMVPI